METLAKILINPLIPAVLYIVWRFVKGGMYRKHIATLFVYLYLVFIPFTSKIMYQLWVVDDTVVTGRQYDAVVVLSGIVPSRCYLENDQVYVDNMFICSGDFKRAYAGLSFIKNGQTNRFIIGNDTSSGIHESKVIKEFLLNNKVRLNQIIISGEVKNTRDEVSKVKQLVESGEISDFILITSAEHMRRAAAIFASQGMNPALYSTGRIKSSSITVKDFLPHKSKPVHRMLYEFAGYAKFILKR